ncbi:hypothetical protein HGRIS_004991 [Hohenbuehelia grisea]|uniref:Uncharacterized protein n=1 Tax=Hohenbuehelia grisea TaxID=104357 RepID=A0ABR3JE28_9AGAR
MNVSSSHDSSEQASQSVHKDLSHLKALGRPEGSLPHDIIGEALVALALGIVGASLNAPKLKEISWASEMQTRSIDEMDSRLGFANYVNRGRTLFSQDGPSTKTS